MNIETLLKIAEEVENEYKQRMLSELKNLKPEERIDGSEIPAQFILGFYSACGKFKDIINKK